MSDGMPMAGDWLRTWYRALDICRTAKLPKSDAQQREFILKVARLQGIGLVPEALVAEALARMERCDKKARAGKLKPIDDRWAWFYRVLANNARDEHQLEWERLLATTTIPPSVLNYTPNGGES